tara:strand:- start:1629 stop:1832 length:204 start_codon:yes stop_codon:yes gene_type:complete
MRSVHFIGFRGDEYHRAARVFGTPDFVHMTHDRRMYGDVGEDDILVFAAKADPDNVSDYNWQDHMNW